MSYLTKKEQDAIITDPNNIEAIYIARWRSFATDLGTVDIGLRLGAAILPVAFAAIVAWDLKPYGPEPSRFDIRTLLDAESLACDDYVRLAWELSALMYQTTWAPLRLAALGWMNGVIGNHAQMMVSDGTETLLLDPTIGLVARVKYDKLLMGVPVHPDNIMYFSRFNPNRGLEYFTNVVRSALINGSYRPSDALYFADSIEDYNTLPSVTQWQTPAAARFRF